VTSEQTDSGIYLLVLDMPFAFSAVVGRLGRVAVDPGTYAYVGSARRGLHSRLNRHRRRRKPLHWHVDRLTRVADVLAAITWSWCPGRECALARALEETGLGQVVAQRFGASDCRCAGHLLAVSDVDLHSVAERLTPLLRAETARVQYFGRSRGASRRRKGLPGVPAAV
jgi:sugar fermentation stimulation protein A